MVVDLLSKNVNGKDAAVALEKAGIECSYSTIPYDKNPPSKPSGIRLGLSILTTLGMKEDDMSEVAAYINKAIDNINDNVVLAEIANCVSNFVSKYANK